MLGIAKTRRLRQPQQISPEGIDVLLIRPYSDMPFHTPPLGLGYLASALIKNKITVDIKDFLIDYMSIDEAAAFIRKNKVKVIGISCCTNEVMWVRGFTAKIKSALPVKIVVGGPHPSGVMEKIYEDIEAIDYSVYCEGEYALPMLIKALLGNSDPAGVAMRHIPNLIWKDGGKIVKNYCELPGDLDDLDFPAWELISPKRYSCGTPHGFIYKRIPFASMICTRGCPNNCGFCGTGNIHGRRLRKRSVGNLIAEIEYLYKRYGTKEIFFEDDNFTWDREFVKDFCGRIIEADFDILFSLPNGVCIDTLDEDTLRVMRKAKFYSFAVGIESGSERILRRMGKGADFDMMASRIDLAKKHGFYVTGFFIIGYPGETRDDIFATIQYAKKLKIDKAAFSKYIPLPGTASYDELIQGDELSGWRHFEAMSVRDIPYSPKGISKDELKGYISKAVKEFYFRPSLILKHIFCWSLLLNIKTLFRLAANFALAPSGRKGNLS